MASSKRKSFLLRIDPQLHADLENWAAQELRSVNGQIEFLLRDALQRRRKSAAPASEPPPAPAAPPESTPD